MKLTHCDVSQIRVPRDLFDLWLPRGAGLFVVVFWPAIHRVLRR